VELGGTTPKIRTENPNLNTSEYVPSHYLANDNINLSAIPRID